MLERYNRARQPVFLNTCCKHFDQLHVKPCSAEEDFETITNLLPFECVIENNETNDYALCTMHFYKP